MNKVLVRGEAQSDGKIRGTATRYDDGGKERMRQQNERF